VPPVGYIGSTSIEAVRSDFPILSEVVEGRPLVWLDNAATTQKPRAVIDRLSYYYEHENSNVHRGAHTLAARSDDAYEAARQKVADFLGAGAADDIVFVRGTTEGINLVAQSFVRPRLAPGDEIVLTLLEHHANIVPWQLVAEATGAVLRVATVDPTGQIDLGAYSRLFTHRTRFVSLTQVSNALGTITPAAEMIQIAHGHGVPVLVDGAQSVSHLPVNVTSLDADFFVFSGHKVFGPTGIGAVYGKPEHWEEARPYQGGGNMIADVTFARTVYQPAPAKFEAGTGNIADAVGLGAALDYVERLGRANIAAYEHWLLDYATEALLSVPGLHLIGQAALKTSIASFVLDGHTPVAVGQALAAAGIAVRAGHHCAQPILRHFGHEATVRPSLAFYNTPEEIDEMVAVLRRLTA
jgi:cysteine desulfurase/selenocysteine lyase